MGKTKRPGIGGAEEKRHIRTYLFLAAALSGIIQAFFHFKSEHAPAVKDAYLVLANHNTDFDPLLIATSFRQRHMYFVASEHVYRAGFWSTLLKRYFAPIARRKGDTDANAAMHILRRLKKGHSVCLFAEGDRSWTGETGAIHPSTAKLVKAAGATLITYRLEGGYFTSPRWSSSLRKGRMRGEVVNVYTPERIREMATHEVHAAISGDIYENAYARQQRAAVAFSGRNLAKDIETALYLCPVCGKIGGLHPKGDEFFCDACATAGAYTEFGLLTGDFPYDTILDWDRYQKEKLQEMTQGSQPEAPIFQDDGFTLLALNADHSEEQLARGELSMSRRALCCGGREFLVADIAQMSMFGRMRLVFVANGGYYELRPGSVKCTRKYLELYNILKK